MRMDRFPSYRRGERIADICVHALGVTLAPIAAIALVIAAIRRGDPALVSGVVLYGIGLTGMLAASALYNVIAASPRKAFFRRLDHAVIFVMIAGSYTPFALSLPSGTWNPALLAIVWMVALCAAVLKLWAPRTVAVGASTAIYLVLGWCCLAALVPLFGRLATAPLILLLAGCGLYSLGAVFHHWRRLPFHNATWHGFVLAAAASHYGAIMTGVVRNGPMT